MSPRPLLLCFLTAFLWTPAPAQTDSCASSVRFFPGEKLFPDFRADALAHGISLTKVTENAEWIGTIGGALPLVQVDLPCAVVQGTVAVTTFNRLIKHPGHLTVVTIDYKVDFPIDLRLGAWGFRAGPGHISCHFADDGLELLGKRSIQSIRDYVAIAVSRDLRVLGGYVYAGANYNYHIVPIREKKWQLQCGFEAGNLPLGSWGRAYGAVDLKLREDAAWGATQEYQVGVKVFPREQYALRVAYTHRAGMEERGQYFLDRATVNLVGLYLDF
jgi:hypothetical protein